MDDTETKISVTGVAFGDFSPMQQELYKTIFDLAVGNNGVGDVLEVLFNVVADIAIDNGLDVIHIAHILLAIVRMKAQAECQCANCVAERQATMRKGANA